MTKDTMPSAQIKAENDTPGAGTGPYAPHIIEGFLRHSSGRERRKILIKVDGRDVEVTGREWLSPSRFRGRVLEATRITLPRVTATRHDAWAETFEWRDWQ
jgi:hypothetical protein